MNEITFEQAPIRKSLFLRLFGTRENRRSSAFYGYSLTIIALGIGWLIRDHDLITPADGFGYWLGIVGGSMMLALLLYPLRKRIRMLRFLGRATHWFQAHMFLGVLGPVLVLYHSDSGDTANMAKFVAEGVRSVDDTELRFKTINAADSDDLRKKRPRIESFH